MEKVELGNFAKFKRDLATGQVYERIAVTKLLKHYGKNCTLLSTCDDIRYDFILSNNMSYEVKSHPFCFKYNSIFVEYMAFGKDSGIVVSQSNYYVNILIDGDVVK